jgi:tRNA G18 (ribose-2'-O)-methylase SpoU
MISIGVYHPKYEVNLGTLWRAAHLFGASQIFTIGMRYKPQASDTSKAWRHIPLITYPDLDAFQACRPFRAPLVGVELTPEAVPVHEFEHPKQAIYLLGAEDHGLPARVLEKCQHVVRIEAVAPWSMNVAMAGSIILHDRLVKQHARTKVPA